MDLYDKDPKSPFHNLRGTFGVILLLVVGMSVFAYICLSTNKYVLPAALLLLIMLEIVQLIILFKEGKKLDIGCEVAFFLVFFSAFFGIYRKTFTANYTFLLATVFYRPNYTLYCNRRLALILGLLIMAVALPITCGIVTGRETVDLLSTLYALLVAGLWVFCSKLGAKGLGFGESS